MHVTKFKGSLTGCAATMELCYYVKTKTINLFNNIIAVSTEEKILVLIHESVSTVNYWKLLALKFHHQAPFINCIFQLYYATDSILNIYH